MGSYSDETTLVVLAATHFCEVRCTAELSLALPDFVDCIGNVLVELVDAHLLLLQAVVGLLDALVQRVVLAKREVRRLTVLVELLGFTLLVLLVLISGSDSEHLCPLVLLF